jgi:hypothetical protein
MAVPLARRQVGIVEVDAVHRPAVRLEPLDDGAPIPAAPPVTSAAFTLT